MDIKKGIVLRSQSGFFTIQMDDGEEITAKIRGKLKRGRKTTDLIAVGDQVMVSFQKNSAPMIEEIEERKTAFIRNAPTSRGEYEQVIVANPDEIVFVFACNNPAPNLRMLDRFLVIAEKQELPVRIIANKLDLVNKREAKAIFNHYPDLGYPVLYTSVIKNIGIDKLKQLLAGKLSVLIGPSGVGKSSLMNTIQPGLGLAVQQVSESSQKGKHTTVVRQMFPLKDGGFIADTPGLKTLPLWDIEPEELDGYFPEIAPLVPQCKYNNCSHIEEPGCAVIEAVEKGEIHPERYESYVRIRMGGE
ncbi:MAG: ribosome small subunit-dependent GTPase A [Anaerolineales bacterium]|nr:ribosome small subunit-dependent GTPase A [Anaerolineales bacterium]